MSMPASIQLDRLQDWLTQTHDQTAAQEDVPHSPSASNENASKQNQDTVVQANDFGFRKVRAESKHLGRALR